MSRSTTRLAAGALALVLPLSAVAACGAEKKKTIKAEFESAQQFLEDSKAASFTLRVDDAKGNLEKLAAGSEDAPPPALIDALLGASITYVVDPAGDKTLGETSGAAASVTDLGAQLKTVNLAYVIKDDKGELGEIRLVEGVLYVHVDLDEIKRLAEEGGVEDFDAELDAATADGPPELATLVDDVRAGKWVKLDVNDYLDELEDLTAGLTGLEASPGPSEKPFDAAALGRRLYDGIKPYVTVTDANDTSEDRVLDVTVDVQPALKAALRILSASDDLPFPDVFSEVDPAEVDKEVKPGKAKGQIRLADGHLKQVTVDVESIRLLAKDPGKDSLAGTSVVFDIDDSADEVETPKDLSSVDLGELVQDFLDALSGEFEESYTG